MDYRTLFSILSVVVFPLCGSATELPVLQFQMEEIWRIGVEDDGILFGEVEDVLIDDDGTVYVLDSQLADVKVFSAEGEHLRTIGREGDGPGEVRAPGDLAFMADGSLGLVSKLNWKIAKIDKETGDPRGDVWALGIDGDLTMIHQVRATGNGASDCFTALIKESTGQFWHWRMYLGLYREFNDGNKLLPEEILCEVGEASGSDIEEEEFFTIWDPWTVDSLGRTVIAPYWGRYLLQYHDARGDLIDQVELPYRDRERSETEKTRLLDKVWGGTSPEPFGVELEISQTEAVVRKIHPRAEGRLWIRTCNSAHEVGPGVFRVYDVVDFRGILEAKAEIQGQADDLVDRVYFGPDNLMVVVHGAERYVQNHRGLKKDAPDYELTVAAYHLLELSDAE